MGTNLYLQNLTPYEGARYRLVVRQEKADSPKFNGVRGALRGAEMSSRAADQLKFIGTGKSMNPIRVLWYLVIHGHREERLA